MNVREQIVAVGRGWMTPRTPFHHQQAVKGVGCDCIGFIGGVAAEAGIDSSWVNGAAARFQGYGREPNPAMIETACAAFLVPIPIAAATLADIFLLRWRKLPQHFALISRLDPMYILHAWESPGEVVENRVDIVWRSRVLRAYRFRGLA
ncbi:MAG: hypothetical protein WC809_18820 [Sinimarinibacterium sp.]|jgi:hypothetical protein